MMAVGKLVLTVCSVLAILQTPEIFRYQATTSPVRVVLAEYPLKAKQGRVQGVLKIAFETDDHGLVTSAEVLDKDTTSLFFAASAINAVWQWRFPSGQGTKNRLIRFTYKIFKGPATRDQVVLKSWSEVEIQAYIPENPQ